MKIKYFYFFHVINVIESGIIVGVKNLLLKILLFGFEDINSKWDVETIVKIV